MQDRPYPESRSGDAPLDPPFKPVGGDGQVRHDRIKGALSPAGRAILHRLGWLLVILALAMVLPALLALIKDDGAAVLAFGTSAVITLFGGGGLVLALRGPDDEGDSWIALSFVGLAWVVLPLFAAMPLAALGDPALGSYFDAYFEAVAALTTTGGFLVAPPDAVDAAWLWRAMLQWLGGLGSLIVATTVFAALFWGGFPIMNVPIPGGQRASVMARLPAMAGLIWPIYGTVSLIACVLVWILGALPLDALVIGLSGMATGGMMPGPDDLIGVGSSGLAITLVSSLVMVVAGANIFTLWYVLTGRWQVLRGDLELRAYGIILTSALIAGLAFSFLLGIDARADGSPPQATMFLMLSLLTTGGWTLDGNMAGHGLPFVLVLALPAIGGMIFSTAGGFKGIRLVILFKHAHRELSRLAHPNGVARVRFRRFVVEEATLSRVGAVFLAVLLATGALTLAVAAFGTSFKHAIAASLAALSNCGPAFALAVSDEVGFRDLPEGARAVLCAGMILGRLEVLALLSLMNPAYWLR